MMCRREMYIAHIPEVRFPSLPDRHCFELCPVVLLLCTTDQVPIWTFDILMYLDALWASIARIRPPKTSTQQITNNRELFPPFWKRRLFSCFRIFGCWLDNNVQSALSDWLVLVSCQVGLHEVLNYTLHGFSRCLPHVVGQDAGLTFSGAVSWFLWPKWDH